jgi:Zn finger protein HypA/HybF involved in hydrogenase expression
MSDEVIHLTVVPADGKCEGCGELIGDELFETDDMVVVCRKCWDDCVEEIEAL